MKPALWRQAVTRYVLPDLPGRWRAAGWVAHAEPVGWLSRALLVSKSSYADEFWVNAIVQLLPVPRGHWVANVSLELRPPAGWWPQLTSLEEAEPAFAEIGEQVRAKALPFFHRYDLDGYMSYLDGRVAHLDERLGDGGWQSLVVDEELVYIHLLRGDLDAALQAGEWANRAARATATHTRGRSTRGAACRRGGAARFRRCTGPAAGTGQPHLRTAEVVAAGGAVMGGRTMLVSAVRCDDWAAVGAAIAGYAAEYGVAAEVVPAESPDADSVDVAVFAPANGWTVLAWPPYQLFVGFAAGRALSAVLSTVVSCVHMYEEDLWVHVLFDQGIERDRYASVPDYFERDPEAAADLRRRWAGNADAIAAATGVAAATITPSLTTVDDPWIFVDFWRRLGIDYDDEPEEDPGGVEFAPRWEAALPPGTEWSL